MTVHQADPSADPVSESLAAQRRLSEREVAALAGIGRSTLWAHVRRGRFPAPHRLGSRFTRWRAGEVLEFLKDPEGWIATHSAAHGGTSHDAR
jgi:prophage regulatory protein